jgi:hypothetical protein
MLIGIVGKPSCGKSTFFKAITLAEVGIAPYPFTTIKPNEGVGFVRVPCIDRELGVQCMPREGYCLEGTRFVPVKLMDVAGLVPGAHLGKGLGLQFLDDLRQADCLIHIVDAAGATNERGESVEPGSYDPAEDVRFLEFELDMWFLGILMKGWDKMAKQAQHEGKEAVKPLAVQLSGLNVKEEHIHAALKKHGMDPVLPASWSGEQLRVLATELRRMTKPIIIAANKIDLPPARPNIDRLRREFPDHTIVPCSADSELALRLAAKAGLIGYVPGQPGFTVKGTPNPAQAAGLDRIRTLLQDWGSTGVQQCLDAAVFEKLRYIAVFPGGVGKLGDQFGNILPDCFLLPPGSTALDFAFRVHTSLGEKFIRAIDVRTKKPVGKDHPLKHRDVMEIVAGR